MTKLAYGEIIARIRQMCATKEGTSRVEIAKALNIDPNAATAYLYNFEKSGEVIKAGVNKYFRFFKNQADADAHNVIAKQDEQRRKIESRKRKNAYNAENERKKRAFMKAHPELIDPAVLAKIKERDRLKSKAKAQREKQKRLEAKLATGWKPETEEERIQRQKKQREENNERRYAKEREKREIEKIQKFAIAQQLKNQKKAAKDRDKRDKIREEKGLPPIDRTARLTKKKPMSLLIQSKQQGLDQLRQHKSATIVWPEDVKVQVIPTPVDMRFKAEPGYMGSFTKEWQERRAA